jgi:hypothetical protein
LSHAIEIQLEEAAMKAKAVVLLFTLTLASNEALAIQWCKLEIKSSNGSLTTIETADRNQSFFGKNVDKLDDCDTCWSEGKKNGPGKCTSTSTQYVITCMKNDGKTKSESFACP